nr:helicase-associated domain-containing protein [Cohnella lubricantis]
MADTLARLPAEEKERLQSQPLIRDHMLSGHTLDAALSGAEWAARWAEAAKPLDRQLLLRLVRSYAGQPFGEEEAEARLRQAPAWTGAEIRVALARMRRDGVLFAIRKAWGERLLYVPADLVGVWQLVLRPLTAGTPIRKEPDLGEREAQLRLPLSLALLSAWSDIRRKGLPLTAKGAPNKQRLVKLAEAMALKEIELKGFEFFALPDPAVPANVALALDLGLSLGWLIREPQRIVAASSALESWADLPLAAVDAKLLEIVTIRYAGQEATMHWAAIALRAMPPHEWFEADDALRQWGEELVERERLALDRWTGLLVAFGWMERIAGRDQVFLRWLIDPTLPALRSTERAHAGHDGPGDGVLYIQPDLDIIVPPEATYGVYWRLEQIAERTSLDIVSTYRITRSSCIRAGEDGYTLSTLTDWLERVSGAALPDPAAHALEDWFGRIGKLSIVDAKLLRVASKELADRIAGDGPLSDWLLERLNDYIFAVKPEGVRVLARRLSELGYPLAENRDSARPGSSASEADSSANASEAAAEASAVKAASGADLGWIRLKQLLAIYEPDGSIPKREELFPGVESIPSVWLEKPRSYHPSTRREIIERAMAWRTGVRVKRVDGWIEFIPEALVTADGSWKVEGTVRTPHPGGTAKVEWSGDSLGELMIELPDGASELPRTNH